MEVRINYKTALIADDKGFSWPTNSLFLPNKVELDVDWWCDWNHEEYYEDEENGEPTSRPTQAQLQKWLRELHDIHVNPTNNNGYYMLVVHSDKYRYNGESLLDVTYEKVLEKGLVEGLKLLK